MNKQTTHKRRRGLLAAFAACALTCAALACAFVAPTRALAADVLCHSVDELGQVTNYYTIVQAFEAGYSGKTLVMDKDWDVQDLRVDTGEKLTIDMNGHKIACTDPDATAVIRVKQGAELTLTSSKTADFWYWHYSDDGKSSYTGATTGGLVTHGDDLSADQVKFSGVSLAEKATLNLDNVYITGCYAADKGNDGFVGGGVTMYRYSTLNMTNNAKIEGNRSRVHGAGVMVQESDTTITMNNSSISGNHADERGGGICINGYRVNITMNNDSKIENNVARAGGGVYAHCARFTLKSDDGTAVISRNLASSSSKTSPKWEQSGGGIHVRDTFDDDPSVLIENITITKNRSFYDGGGLELDYKGITVRNCKITDNACKYEGGGAYICANGDTFDSCTITGNACSVNSGGNYEGGGVFVWHSYDIGLKGLCVIKGNTRGENSGNADDVFLREDAWTSTKAYITGSLAPGSTVGVRTGYTKDRRIAKSFSCKTNDCLFIDLSGYYVSYGNDEGGDAWQRHRDLEFAAKIDGVVKGRWKYNSTATLVAPTFKGDRIFWRWDKDTTQGLYPVDEYLTDDALENNVFTFKMPQNDVDLGTFYTTRAEAAEVSIEKPADGQALPATAKVRRDDNGIGGYGWTTASVTWYEVDGDKLTLAGGTAKAGTVYRARISCASDPSIPLYFKNSITADNVKVTYSDWPARADAASVDSVTGVLTVEKTFDATAGEKGSDEAAGGKVAVKLVNGGIEAGLGGGSSTEAAAVAALSDGEGQGAEKTLGKQEVVYAEGSSDVTVAAPAVEGYNFCNWEGVPAGVEYDDAEGYVTLPASALSESLELTAVYTPAVTRVEVETDEPAPVAGGQKLATKVSHITLTAFDGSTFDLVEAIGAGERPVTWSPESEDGLAAYSTAYAALVELADGDGLEGVEKVLASGAQVSVTCAGGAVEAEAAGFTVVDGKLCLALSFAKTPDLKATGVEQPAAVEVSFEDAAAGNWQLPKTVQVKLENGEAVEGDVTWEAVEGFDANAATTQELQVKGTVTHIAYDGDLDTEGLDLGVTVTVKVAAPAQDDSAKDDDTTKTETTATTTKTASKKGTPSTGDATFTGAAALLALSVICLAAARLSRRNN